MFPCCQVSEGKGVCGKTVRVFLRDLDQPAAAARFALGKPGKLQKEKTGIACLFLLCQGENYTFWTASPYPTANPAERIAVGSEEKARPAYEKALRPFSAKELARTRPKPSAAGSVWRGGAAERARSDF